MISIDKKQKQILLISVQDNLSVIGLKYVHYSLLESGWQSYLLYLKYLDLGNLENLQSFISQINPIFIGLSLMSTEYKSACDLSNYLKRHFPTIPIIWGGVHPTIEPESCFPFADYVCIGEGERTVLDIANHLYNWQDIKKIPNLCYREDGRLRKNPLYPLIDNLDNLPHIDHIPKNSFLQKADCKISLIDRKVFMKESRYRGKMYELMTSRGCAFKCTYCCNNFFTNLYASKKIRRRSVENILSELKNALENNPEIEVIHFQDDSFMSCSTEYLIDFCRVYRTEINKSFIIHTIPVYITRDKLKALKEAGLSLINMGLQSGSDKVCRDIYKRNSLRKHFLRAAELINEFKIAGKHDVILDNPFESENERIKTIETLIMTPKPYLIEFYSLTFYPGTELYKKAMTECPEKMENVYEKNYLDYKQNILNNLTSLSVYLPGIFIRKLLQLYKDNPRNVIFKITFSISQILSTVFYRPKTLFKVFKMSQGDSYVKTFLGIPMYLKEAFIKKL